MEFKFDIRRAIRWDPQGLFILFPRNDQKTKEISEIIDAMGKESSRAQGLRSVITTSIRFFSSSDNKIYLKAEGNKVVGILKTGCRKLFYTNEIGKIIEMSPLCLLDFYVHESCQRSGHGKELYEFMLRNENSSPNKVAIDRPSQKLIAFMRKHYALSDYIPQNNNYVIYRQYFSSYEYVNQRTFEENKINLRTSTQNCERIQRNSNNYERSPINKQDYDRNISQINERSPVSMQNNEIISHRSTQDHQREPVIHNYSKVDDRRNYAPVAPWATVSRFTLPNTTSSQYGSHAYRK